jgi:hypothetical protein
VLSYHALGSEFDPQHEGEEEEEKKKRKQKHTKT